MPPMFVGLANARMRSMERGREEQEAEIRRNALSQGLEHQQWERSQRTEGVERERAQAIVAQRQREAQERSLRLVLKAKGIPEEQHDAYIGNPSAAADYLKPESGDDVNWQTEVDEGGNIVRINPRTGKTEYVSAPSGGTMRARPPASLMMPQPVQFLPTQEGYVSADPRNPNAPVRPLQTQGGQQVQRPQESGATSSRQRMEAIRNTEGSLDELDRTLTDIGSSINPRSPNTALLKSAYEDYQLQLKELYKLGVLAGPDLMLMRSILNDPTSIRTRLESGNAERHAARVRAQIQQARTRLKRSSENVPAGNTPAGGPPPSGVSDADIEAVIQRNTRKP